MPLRKSFYTRALAALAAILALAAFRAHPAGPTRDPKVVGEPTIQTAAALPVELAQEVSYSESATTTTTAPPVTGGPALAWPAPGFITSPFGGGRHHPGIDINGAQGSPVQAAGNGTVLLAGMAPAGYSGYGNVVLIDHGGGIATLYAHLSRVDVAIGQTVQQGQQIGAVGATGFATGPHLHFEVRVNNVPVDPVPWLPPRT